MSDPEIVKRYIFAPIKPCFSYTLEEEPFRRDMKFLLDHICTYMLQGLATSITYKNKYQEGRVNRMSLVWHLCLVPDQSQRQRDYALSIFYRKLGMLETKFLQNDWRLYDVDEPDEMQSLAFIAADPCIHLHCVTWDL